MFSIIQLKAAALDYGISGVTPMHMMLFFLMTSLIPIIPYLFLYLSLPDEHGRTPMSSRVTHPRLLMRPVGRMAAWLHAHHHPQLLHH